MFLHYSIQITNLFSCTLNKVCFYWFFLSSSGWNTNSQEKYSFYTIIYIFLTTLQSHSEAPRSFHEKISNYLLCVCMYVCMYIPIYLRYLQSKYPILLLLSSQCTTAIMTITWVYWWGSVLGLTQQIVISLISHAPGCILTLGLNPEHFSGNQDYFIIVTCFSFPFPFWSSEASRVTLMWMRSESCPLATVTENRKWDISNNNRWEHWVKVHYVVTVLTL